MSKNKLALLRYKTIDQCLRKRYRRWTLQDLVEAASHALYEFEGIPTISLRTVQSDIEQMRSGELGYHAPIIVIHKKYYTYADEHFSIQKLISPKQETEQPQTITFKAERQFVPHILKNPFHDTFTILQREEKSIVFSIDVVPDFGLEREVLGYGEGLVVLSPVSFRERIAERVRAMGRLYG
jgi:WYL domain